MKFRIVLLIISLMMLLTSHPVYAEMQDTNARLERSYVRTEITYSEPIVQYGFRVDMAAAETEFAKYFFEESIDDCERETCIEVTEKILSDQALEGAMPEIYIFSQDRYNYKNISGNRLYLSVQDWESVEYITDVLLAAYGESTHYGTAFGYANYLAQRNDWDSYDGKFSKPSVSDIYDLSLLCFNEEFVSLNDVAAAKEVACNFAECYITQHGEEMLQQLLRSHAKSIEALAEYYKENGVSFIPSAVQYRYGGKKYDYLVYSDYGTFYITEDWTDMNAEYNPLIYDGFLHTNYADTKAFFETNLKQMKQYQDLFKLGDYNNDLDIVFSNPISASKTSFYQSVNHRIYLYNVDSFMHEYIHALTMPTASMQMWQVEGFARYFSYYYDFYGMPFLYQDYNNASDIPELKYIHEYLDAINRPIETVKDYYELENIAVYSRSFTNPNANYVAGSSFVQYLVKEYGEEAVINSIYRHGNPLPAPHIKLVQAWNEYIETNYASYSKYK